MQMLFLEFWMQIVDRINKIMLYEISCHVEYAIIAEEYIRIGVSLSEMLITQFH